MNGTATKLALLLLLATAAMGACGYVGLYRASRQALLATPTSANKLAGWQNSRQGTPEGRGAEGVAEDGTE
jgi:hypothetical protein